MNTDLARDAAGGAHVLDGGRMVCVQLLLLLQRHIRTLEAGAVVHLRTEDPIAVVDLPAWCHLTGHEWLGSVPGTSAPTYAIRVSGNAASIHLERPWRVHPDTGPELRTTNAGPTPGVEADVSGRPPGLDAGTVYLDYNGTTPVDTRVIDALLPYLHTDFGNPSSSHSYGHVPKAAMDRARRDVARLVGAVPDQIVFTGSGSEADALAIRGTVAAAADSGRSRPHLITQATEHPAVLAACRDAWSASCMRTTRPASSSRSPSSRP